MAAIRHLQYTRDRLELMSARLRERIYPEAKAADSVLPAGGVASHSIAAVKSQLEQDILDAGKWLLPAQTCMRYLRPSLETYDPGSVP